MNQVDDYEYFCHSCEDVKRTSDIEIIYDGEIKCKSCNHVGFVEKIDEDDPLSFHSINSNRERRNMNEEGGGASNDYANNLHTPSGNDSGGGRGSTAEGSANNRGSNRQGNRSNSSGFFGTSENFFNDLMMFRNVYQQMFNTNLRPTDADIHFTANFGTPAAEGGMPDSAPRNDAQDRVFFGRNYIYNNGGADSGSGVGGFGALGGFGGFSGLGGFSGFTGVGGAGVSGAGVSGSGVSGSGGVGRVASDSGGNGTNGSSVNASGGASRNPRSPRIITRAIDITNIPLNSPIRLNFHDLIDNILTNSFDNISLDQVLTIIMESDPSRNGPPPASEAIIKNLKVEVLTKERAEELESCAICREEYKENDEVHRITDNERCRHVFHCSCIIPWLKERNSCPTCRFELPTDDQEYNCKREELRERINSEISRNNTFSNSNGVNVENISVSNSAVGRNDVGGGSNGCSQGNNEREGAQGEKDNEAAQGNNDSEAAQGNNDNEGASGKEEFPEYDINMVEGFASAQTQSIIQNIFNTFILGNNDTNRGSGFVSGPQVFARSSNRNSDSRNVHEWGQERAGEGRVEEGPTGEGSASNRSGANKSGTNRSGTSHGEEGNNTGSNNNSSDNISSGNTNQNHSGGINTNGLRVRSRGYEPVPSGLNVIDNMFDPARMFDVDNSFNLGQEVGLDIMGDPTLGVMRSTKISRTTEHERTTGTDPANPLDLGVDGFETSAFMNAAHAYVTSGGNDSPQQERGFVDGVLSENGCRERDLDAGGPVSQSVPRNMDKSCNVQYDEGPSSSTSITGVVDANRTNGATCKDKGKEDPMGDATLGDSCAKRDGCSSRPSVKDSSSSNPKDKESRSGSVKSASKKNEKRIYEKVSSAYSNGSNSNNSSGQCKESDVEKENLRKKSKNSQHVDGRNNFSSCNGVEEDSVGGAPSSRAPGEAAAEEVAKEVAGEVAEEAADARNSQKKQSTVKKYLFDRLHWLKGYDGKDKKRGEKEHDASEGVGLEENGDNVANVASGGNDASGASEANAPEGGGNQKCSPRGIHRNQ
ncbi:hypothetical protein PCYB_081360 [Plasmodium cynomolgi strain B]|uniref:RING-type domain-containing protein n=1 Tax=Plasmodium cynomolgi (strain B) TaxID=1120755 RepID=K6UUT3_PLACD|nr:hypothetical protein PCYB_081360 [Plasmodium cynomolgi strain B]GAB65975.1 hypothetical protein PCYB_081360 [Plasmodium cynomolgi strain B]